MLLEAYPKYPLHLQDAFHKDCSELITDSSQEKPKQWNAEYGIANTEDLATYSAGCDVSIACSKKYMEEARLQHFMHHRNSLITPSYTCNPTR